jgi:glycosyltransferase involved in cell wall biosynthesis
MRRRAVITSGATMSETASRIWTVIPALNEQDTLESVLRDVQAAGMRSLVVDDGSSDATGDIARKLASLWLRHERSQGYAAALASGMRMLAARDDVSWVVTLDADGQLDPRDAASVVRDADSGGAALAIGIRGRPPRLLERIAASLFRAAFGIRDPFCGMKAFRVDVLKRYLSYAGAHINLALPVKAVLSGERLHQAPVRLSSRAGGKSRFGSPRGQLKLARAIVGALLLGLEGASRR